MTIDPIKYLISLLSSLWNARYSLVFTFTDPTGTSSLTPSKSDGSPIHLKITAKSRCWTIDRLVFSSRAPSREFVHAIRCAGKGPVEDITVDPATGPIKLDLNFSFLRQFSQPGTLASMKVRLVGQRESARATNRELNALDEIIQNRITREILKQDPLDARMHDDHPSWKPLWSG